MVMIKVTEWPKVLPNDDGIRPAGEQDRCFYCAAKIGEPHGPKCVTVTKLVRYAVYMNLENRSGSADRGRKVGTFARHDPYFWTRSDCEFHKNDSSWCAGNALDNIEWSDPADATALEKWMDDNGTDGCTCAPLYFEYAETVDEGPFVELKQEPT